MASSLPPPPETQPPAPGTIAPGGLMMWNGSQWVATTSPDGRYRWNGVDWIPTSPVPVPPPGVLAPGPVNRGSLGYQFGGSAAWAIGLGIVAIIVPFLANFYFPILPLIGIWRSYIAIRAGRTAGGVVGIVVNLLAGVVTLFASGLVGR